MKNLLKKGGKLDKPESSKLGEIVTGQSIQKEGKADPKFIVKRSSNVHDWHPAFTFRSKVPLVYTRLK